MPKGKSRTECEGELATDHCMKEAPLQVPAAAEAIREQEWFAEDVEMEIRSLGWLKVLFVPC